MGVESGAQDVLDAMDKGTRLWQIPEARENLRRHGIRACYFLQFGYPGETWAEIEKTIALVRETRPDDIGVSVSYPLPGTAFHQMVSEPARSEGELGGQRRSGHDVPGRVHHRASIAHWPTPCTSRCAKAARLRKMPGRNVLALKETCARKLPVKLPVWISC